ncbi:TOM1-like protein 2 isoform X1 [Oncorhynchus kisutch]|uniref:Target of myb1 like 2 membrane trafficking protein n=2 Tax=Oncorhynchus kisutch TaxID=8019 RepID=A0A8C7J8D7_ONCKI|nr:TOM1-like protein 2 isoform X1 [Oncorhynchus kisutch]
MEFLLGNPYSTPVGQCLEKATDGGLQAEDWTLNMEICDIINETEEGPKDAIRALKKRLSGNRNYREVMLGLTVLETCVKNCGHRFHVLVANRDFIDGVLVKIISPKTNPPTIVQDKVLALIQAWADAFRSSPDLTGVVHIYEELKRKGIEFPMADLDTLSPIHTPQRGLPEVDPAVLKYKAPIQPHAAATATLPKPAAAPAPAPAPLTPILQIPHIPNVQGPITANPEQIARLRSELDIVRGNTKVMSEMLTEMVPGQEDSSDLELLQELNRTCRAMQQRVVELISRVSNEEVTEELLHVNDDLNNIFLRYERYERYRSGRAAQNNGMLSEATEDNLIDLTPGSPAVVSLRATSTPPSSIPPVTAPRAGATASPARTLIQDPTSGPSTLSTQLAGLDVGRVSVSGTLSSLSGHNPGDDFDMFAQTRTSSLADQRKNVKYEDPRALGGLASALDVRQQNATGGLRVIGDDNPELELPIDSWLITQGMIPVSQSSVMDDIEEWLCADVKGDGEEGVTSEEFDKFLEDRAKVVDSLPSLPGDEPGPPLSAPSGTRKKAERTEDALFAL